MAMLKVEKTELLSVQLRVESKAAKRAATKVEKMGQRKVVQWVVR